MKGTSKIVIGIAAALAVGLDAAPARAELVSGYVCNAYEALGASIYGDHGSVGATVYTGPRCTGSFVGGVVYSSTGATACPAWSSVTEARLISLVHDLMIAASHGLRVDLNANDSCGTSLTVYGN